ncbi:hypothetical protein WANG_1640 [Lactobacillus kefiranofaciens subsp. kefiranofaciens]|nr:hypothetical protein WANG_1640 [Lactobacillus kefiranofaciens subsp. kefiranofaciens]
MNIANTSKNKISKHPATGLISYAYKSFIFTWYYIGNII